MARRVLRDQYFKQAKADGYAARSAYKLIEIDDRNRLLRRGARVLDLGCAPGSWTQVAAERVGPSGAVAGIDLQPTTATLPSHARTVVGDAFQITPDQLVELLGGSADVLLSDMAPPTTGDPRGDHYRSVELCRRVLELAPGVLRSGGSLAMKVFEGAEYQALLGESRGLFASVKGLKPKATRGASVEMFVIATGWRGGGS
ncbi:MAG: RlmE family RNA methyltransferase [Planctomycetota bacterium]